MSAAVGLQVSELDLGSGWRTLHEQARLRGRRPREQMLCWLRYAAAQAQDGKDVELSQGRLEALLALEAA